MITVDDIMALRPCQRWPRSVVEARVGSGVTVEMWRGSVDSSLDLDHPCRNRRCVNPAHMEPVTRKENVRRGLLPELMRTRGWRPGRPLLAACKNGHAMSGDNVVQSSARRWCRACKRLSLQRQRSKREMKTVKPDGSVAFQGDVMFRRVDNLPDGLRQAEKGARENILSYSETGHHHVALGGTYYTSGDPFVAYLVTTGPVKVEHRRSTDTHETLELLVDGPEVVWEVRRQREHTPEGWFRRVED